MRKWLLFMMAVMLVACGRGTAEGTPAPPVPPTRTLAPTFTPIPPTPTLTPVSVRPDSTDLPFTWEIVAEDERGLARQMAGLGRVVDAAPAPEGRWWALRVVREMPPGGPALTSLYLLDDEGDEHWLASEEGNELLHQFDWLPNGRLLWANGEDVILARGDGTEWQVIEAPESVLEVWAARSPMTLVAGENSLWRLDLSTGEWTTVEGLDEQTARVWQSTSNLKVAPGGEAAALIASGALWYIPIAPGEPARQLNQIEYGGRGGRINPLYPLADSPYWLVGELAFGVAGIEGSAAFLLDSRDGALLPVSDLNPDIAPTALPLVSPDGRWIAIPEGEATAAGLFSALTIAPSTNLEGGVTVPAVQLLDWGMNDAALLLTPAGELVRLSLPDGSVTTLLDQLDPQAWPSGALSLDHVFLAYTDAAYAFRADGAGLAALEMPGPGARLLGAHNAKALLDVRAGDESALWLWQVGRGEEQ